MSELANRSGRNRGFTLLELLVVLFILGAVIAVAFPGLQRINASLDRALLRSELEGHINGLAAEVRRSGRSALLDEAPGNSDLPEPFLEALQNLGVTLRAEQPIFISAAGFCPFGGQVDIQIGSLPYRGELRTPDCRLSW